MNIEHIAVGGLEFAIQRSPKRKQVGITVERDGTLTINAPLTCDDAEIYKVAESKLLWVHTKLAQKALYMAAARPRQFVNGEGFYYLGRSYRFALYQAENHAPPLRLHHGLFRMPDTEVLNAREHFVKWYRQHGQTWLWDRAAQQARRVGVDLRGVRVEDMTYYWGECLPDGDIRLHWRVILLPPSIIDYIVVHELAHLRQPNHSPEFWERIERIIPDYLTQKRWLAENGAAYGL